MSGAVTQSPPPPTLLWHVKGQIYLYFGQVRVRDFFELFSFKFGKCRHIAFSLHQEQ